MNVLYVANSVMLYGANSSLMDMAVKVKEKGVNVFILIMGYGDIVIKLRNKGVPVYILPYETNCHVGKNIFRKERKLKLAKNLQYLEQAKEIVKENKIDIIHSNASNIDFGAMLAFSTGIPHIWHIREMMKEDYNLEYDYGCMTRFLFNRAAGVICISGFVAEKRKLGKNRVIIYNGIDLEKYTIDKPALFKTEEIHLLYCGIISESKGTLDVVKAVGYLVNNGITNVHLAIVGGRSSYWDIVNQYIMENNLSDYITYYGHQANVKPYREWADIAVMASKSEALGRVTIESMLGDVLVIGADSGATSELIRDGETGYLYKLNDAEQLGEKIILAYEDIEKSMEIVRKAKTYALENFDDKRYAEKIIELYQSCIKG